MVIAMTAVKFWATGLFVHTHSASSVLVADWDSSVGVDGKSFVLTVRAWRHHPVLGHVIP